MRRYYVLFFIKVQTREVFYAGLTANPTGAWTTQAARNLFLRHGDQLDAARALVRDRGSQFIDSFDEIFRTEGLKIPKTPVRTPVANTFAERWIGSIRRELLDRTIIWTHRQLERLVTNYIAHYNQHRPHQSSARDRQHRPPSRARLHPRPSPWFEPADATASSTNTETPPDQPRPTFRAVHARDLLGLVTDRLRRANPQLAQACDLWTTHLAADTGPLTIDELLRTAER